MSRGFFSELIAEGVDCRHRGVLMTSPGDGNWYPEDYLRSLRVAKILQATKLQFVSGLGLILPDFDSNVKLVSFSDVTTGQQA